MLSTIAFPTRARCAAPLTIVLLALALASCGGSDDGDGGGGSDEQQARATVEALYAAIADGDAEKVCDQLSPDAQEELEKGGLGTKGQSCTDSFQGFLDEAEKAGGLNLTLKAKVSAVKVDGDDAVATVTFGKGRDGEIPLSKVDGEWKLDAAGAKQ
jgi:ketosteroid isomerase-like protein